MNIIIIGRGYSGTHTQACSLTARLDYFLKQFVCEEHSTPNYVVYRFIKPVGLFFSFFLISEIIIRVTSGLPDKVYRSSIYTSKLNEVRCTNNII